MKSKLSLFVLFLLFVPLVHSQEIAGYQKLRGEVISSEPENLYSTHAYNAFDTNEKTTFKAKDPGGWVGLDLKESFTIKKVRVYPRSDRPERLAGAVIQGADNPQFTHPTNLFTITTTPATEQYTTYDIQSEQKFRYVRCVAPEQNCNLAELEFYAIEDAQTLTYPQLTNLPTIYLETGGQFDFVDKEIYATSTVVVSDGSAVSSYSAGVKGRGNSTWQSMDKKSFRIKFDKKQHFLGLPAEAKSWVLIASAVDKTLMRNGLAFEISKFLGFDFTPACKFVDVVLDGFYFGTYFVSDHIEINEKRINVDEMEDSDIELPNLSGGYHLEIDAYADQEPAYFRTNRGVPITMKSPENNIPEQNEWIRNHINQLEEALYTNPQLAFEKYIDLESAVKYYILSELTGNCDSYWCIHTYKKRGDDKLYFGPVWDFDQGFLTNERIPRFSHTLDTNHGVVQDWFRRIMGTAEAQKVLIRLWKEVMSGDLEGRLLSYADENAALLQQSQTLNFQRWNSIGIKVWFEDALFDTYDEYIAFVKGFIQDRIQWFDEYVPEERIELLQTSEPRYPGKEWKYMTTEPESSHWFIPNYDDGSWLTGLAPFGREQSLQNTFWDGNEIYIRTRFQVSQTDYEAVDRLYLTLFHDEDCWVYLNGEEVLHQEGYLTFYKSFEIDKTKLQSGTNTIAIKCVQTIGGQLIDAGVYATAKDQGQGPVTDIDKPETQKYGYNIQDGILYLSNLDANTLIAVYGIDGRLIRHENTMAPTMQIQLPGKGVYIVQIQGKALKVIY